MEVIGDPVQPSDFKLPLHDSATRNGGEGDAFISGNKIWFNNGTSNVLVTST